MKFTDEQIKALLANPGYDVAALAQACRQLMAERATLAAIERSPLEKLVMGQSLTSAEQASLDKETAQLQRHGTPDASPSVLIERLREQAQNARHLGGPSSNLLDYAAFELDQLARELAEARKAIWAGMPQQNLALKLDLAEAELARARELLRDAYSLINACPVLLVGGDSLLEAIDRVLRDDR